MTPHDVWELLRNINRFQFNPSPPMSEESIIVPKKKKTRNKRINRKDTRFVETCRTEEIAYISSYTVDDSSRSLTQSSSFDRITVIDNNDEFKKISNAEDKFLKIRYPIVKNKNSPFESRNKIEKKRVKNGNVKNICYPVAKGNRTEIKLKQDTNKTIQTNFEDSQSYDEIPSFINIADIRSYQNSIITSVCSNTEDNELEFQSVSDKRFAYISDNPIKMKISVDRLKGEKKEVKHTKHPPSPNNISKVTSSSGISCEYIPIALPRNDAQKQNSRLVTTLPKTCIIPKLTQNELNTKTIVNHLKSKYGSYCSDNDSNKLNITNNGQHQIIIAQDLNNRKTVNDSIVKNKIELKRIAGSPKSNISQAQKPITQFKNRMLSLLHKKVSAKVMNRDFPIESKPCNIKMKTEACTGTQNNSTARFIESPRAKEHDNPIHFLNKKPVISFKYPWAKAKRASDFIENVIKNIKNGVYYSKDHKYVNRITENAMQTDPTSDQEEICENYFSPKVTIKKKSSIAVIPGFESSLPGLEIKTLNMKQIAIKHCVTNVMIQFDVTVPAVIDNVAKSTKTSSVVPIEVTETHTKIFKCKTSILNAMLPAELCSIVPIMMKVIDPSRKSIVHPYCPALVDKTKSNLSTITEMSRNEVTTLELNKTFESIVHQLSPLKKLLEGAFSKTHNHLCQYVMHRDYPIIHYEYTFIINLLPKLHNDIVIPLPAKLKSIKPACLNPSKNVLGGLTNSVRDLSISSKCNGCTALDIYSTKNKRLVPAYKLYEFTDFIRCILKSQAFRPHIHAHNGTKMYLYMNINMTIQNMSIIPQFSEDVDMTKYNEISTKSIEYIKYSTKCTCENKDQQSEHVTKLANNKYKRKSFCRLYKKCKSSSSIPSGKNINTPLNKIQTLEDFIQILGSKQLLSGVFDGYTAKKILASIVEMKNWITEINPSQALLILLLTNKKDTPNLIRYRPVLLQGIAVNRITRATELDMEIEVIERENLNKLPQYEGISYITASVENHDQLLEELYWIAKTTASDYQKPFDETSEKLLKSLLEKRKKLNPSYLRVMARYVGLGLLKHPRRNENQMHSNPL